MNGKVVQGFHPSSFMQILASKTLSEVLPSVTGVKHSYNNDGVLRIFLVAGMIPSCKSEIALAL